MKILNLFAIAAILVGCNVQTNKSHSGSLDLISGEQFADIDTKYLYGDSAWGKYRASSLYGTNKLVLTFDDGPHSVNIPKDKVQTVLSIYFCTYLF